MGCGREGEGVGEGLGMWEGGRGREWGGAQGCGRGRGWEWVRAWSCGRGEVREVEGPKREVGKVV